MWVHSKIPRSWIHYHVTMVNDLSLLPMGKRGQGLDLQAKRSTFNEETFFIPFDDVAPSVSTFEAEEIRWTLGKTCTGRERSKKIDKHWNMCVLGLTCMRGVVWLNQNRKFVYQARIHAHLIQKRVLSSLDWADSHLRKRKKEFVLVHPI